MAVVPTSSHGGSGGTATLLSTTTLGADGTFDVSGIAQTYNDLQLVLIARGTRAAAGDTLILRLNNDSGANYSFQISGFGGASGATGLGARTAGTASPSMADYLPSASATANFFGVYLAYIPGYTSTTWVKNVLTTYYGESGSTDECASSGILWNSTAAVTRIQILGGTTANLKSGSQLRIYGVT